MRTAPSRKPQNKAKGARQFRHNSRTTHPKNMKMVPHRGGWRL